MHRPVPPLARGYAVISRPTGEPDNMLNVVLIVVQVLASLTLIFLILLHSGRGGGLSDMFGGGQLGGSMAGSTVVERNLDRLTVITSVIFLFSTVLLALRLD
jgi:preprotein translocase subunit SecG